MNHGFFHDSHMFQIVSGGDTPISPGPPMAMAAMAAMGGTTGPAVNLSNLQAQQRTEGHC